MKNRILLWVKIVCFLILYLLISILILSMLIDELAKIVALLNIWEWQMYFGLYLVITGISTHAISSWKGKMQAQQLISTGKVAEEDRKTHENLWRVANATAGVLFIIEGLLFLISGVGVFMGWFPSKEIFGSMTGILMVIFLLVLPLMLAPILGAVFCSRQDD